MDTTSGKRTSPRTGAAAIVKDDDVSSDNGKMNNHDHVNSRVYNKRVIKILQKHFLNRIPHPYINK